MLVGLVGLAVLACVDRVSAQPGDGGAVESMSSRWPALRERLAALVPSDPQGYFLLGEEVAGEAMTPGERSLARRLHALAFGLATRDAASDDGLRASAALALADLASSDRDRAWLRAIARSLSPGAGGAAEAFTRHDERVPVSPETALDAARAIGLLRSGDGREAGRLLARDEIERVLSRYSGLITETGPFSLMRTLRLEAAAWPDPTCRGRRFITARVTRSGETVREIQLCPACGGDPGWAPEPEAFIGTLRLESRLLRGVQRSWSAQLAADRGAVLRDPDPEDLASSLGYDVDRALWRAGGWVAAQDHNTPSDPGGAGTDGGG